MFSQPDSEEGSSSNSYDRTEIATHNLSNTSTCQTASGRKSPAKAKKLRVKSNDSEFVFFDRHSVMLLDNEEIRGFPEAKELINKQDKLVRTSDKCLVAPTQRRGSLGSQGSSLSAESFPAVRIRSPEMLTLFSTLEAVLNALEEPKGETVNTGC